MHFGDEVAAGLGVRYSMVRAVMLLCAVLLAHEPKADTLTAYATLGGELFDEFFRKYEMKLSLDVGPKAKNAVAAQAVVRELERYCKNPVVC